MDSLFDIGWRIVLGLAVIGLVVLFVQNRTKNGPDELSKEWTQHQEAYDSTASENRPTAAPSFDQFN
jgi:hypothetical protein